jgi:PleD family two-component response regulator
MVALVVSRSEARRALLARVLGSDWTVHEALDGHEAVRACLEVAEIGVVIADETTEPMGAFALSRELKYMEDAPAIIVLLDRSVDAWLAAQCKVDRALVGLDAFELADAARTLWAERIHAARADA